MVFNTFSFQRLVALERKTFKGHIQPWKWPLLLCGTGSWIYWKFYRGRNLHYWMPPPRSRRA